MDKPAGAVPVETIIVEMHQALSLRGTVCLNGEVALTWAMHNTIKQWADHLAALRAPVVPSGTLEQELNGWRELGEEMGRIISAMTPEDAEDYLPDWFGPRLFDMQVKGAALRARETPAEAGAVQPPETPVFDRLNMLRLDMGIVGSVLQRKHEPSHDEQQQIATLERWRRDLTRCMDMLPLPALHGEAPTGPKEPKQAVCGCLWRDREKTDRSKCPLHADSPALSASPVGAQEPAQHHPLNRPHPPCPGCGKELIYHAMVNPAVRWRCHNCGNRYASDPDSVALRAEIARLTAKLDDEQSTFASFSEHHAATERALAAAEASLAALRASVEQAIHDLRHRGHSALTTTVSDALRAALTALREAQP